MEVDAHLSTAEWLLLLIVILAISLLLIFRKQFVALANQFLLRPSLSAEASKTVAADKSALLSGREKEVLAQMLQGKSQKEIAASLFVEVSTVKTHINRIYKLYGVRDRKELLKSVAAQGN